MSILDFSHLKSWLKAQHSENEDHGITSWQIDGETVKTVSDFFLGPPKSLQMVIADMKLRLLLLGRKVMTTLDSIFKSRDITLPTKVRLVKAMFFSSGHVWL